MIATAIMLRVKIGAMTMSKSEDLLLDKIKEIFDRHKQTASIELLIDLAIFVTEQEQKAIKEIRNA